MTVSGTVPFNSLFMKYFLATAFSVLLFSSAMTAQKATDKYSAFTTAFRSECKNAGIVGSSFVFLKDGKVAAEDHFGSANLEKKQPVNADTIYHWASNTKPFTGIAIMQLRDRGLAEAGRSGDEIPAGAA